MTAAAFLLLAWPLAAQTIEAPPGGRPAALGHAYTALCLDAYAPAWNPAAPSQLRSPQAGAFHRSGLGRSPLHAMSVAFPVADSWGAGMSAEMADGAGAGGMALSRRLGQRWSLGAAARSDARRQRWAEGALLYRYDNHLAVGAVVGRRQARLAAAYAPAPWLTYALEGVTARAGRAAVRSGLEAVAYGMLAARVGIDSGLEGSPALGLTAGLGLLVAGHSLDFSVVPQGAGTAQQVSLIVRFGAGARDVPASTGAVRRLKAATPARPLLFHLPADWEAPSSAPAPERPALEQPEQPPLIWLE